MNRIMNANGEKKQKKAFTLVECLIAMGIISILMVILVLSVEFATSKAEETGVQTDFRAFQEAIHSVGVEQQGFYFSPNGVENLETLADHINRNLDHSLRVSVQGDELVSTAKDPWGNHYKLVYSKDENTNGAVKLVSVGQDRTPNTNDDVISIIKYVVSDDGWEIVYENDVAVTECQKNGHQYDKKITTDSYLKSKASCLSKAVYYYACSVCGAKSGSTYESGSIGTHVYSVKDTNASHLYRAATCNSKAKYYYSCSGCGQNGSEVFESGNMLKHSFTVKDNSNECLVSPASCTSPAVYKYKCDKCNAIGSLTYTSGEKLGHVYESKIHTDTYLASPATCTKKATYYFKCNNCDQASGKSLTYEYGELAEHDFSVKSATSTYLAKPASCTNAALYYYKCSKCTAHGVQTYTSGKAKDHTYEESVVLDATCTSEGIIRRSCMTCDRYYELPLEKLDHNYLPTNSIPAVCTANGTEEYTCTMCGDVQTETIPMLGHSYQSFETTCSICLGDQTTYTCRQCGHSYIEADCVCNEYDCSVNGHDWDVVSETDGTCMDPAEIVQSCAYCNEERIITGDYGDHNYSKIDSVPSTCTEDGYDTYECSVCGDTYSNVTSSAPGHDFIEIGCDGEYHTYECTHCHVINQDTCDCATSCEHDYYKYDCDETNDYWTCRICGDEYESPCDCENDTCSHNYYKYDCDNGIDYWMCSICGDEYTAECNCVCEHYYEVTDEEEATCTTDGYTTYTCSECGHSYSDTIDATGHSYGGQILDDATCTSTGRIYKLCSECGDDVTVSIINKKDHNHQYVGCDGSIHTYKCVNCSDSYTEDCDCVCEHNYEITYTKEATCTAEGYDTYTCSKCGNEYNEPIDIIDHSYGSSITIDPTCVDEGRIYKVCSECGNKKDLSTIDALGHNYECSSVDNNQHAYTCSECSDSYKENHTFGEELTKDSTCTSEGRVYKACSECSHEITISTIEKKDHNHKYVGCDGSVHTYKCENCSDSYTEDCDCVCEHNYVCSSITETQHKYTCSKCSDSYMEDCVFKTIDTVESTCVDQGYNKDDCIYCDNKRTVPLDLAAHTWGAEVIEEPTCTEDGRKTKTCSVCGEIEELDFYPYTGHSFIYDADGLVDQHRVNCTQCDYDQIENCEYTNIIETFDGNCLANSYNMYQCTYCENLHKVEGSLGDHLPNINTATCEEDKVCEICHEVLQARSGHNWEVDGECQTCAYCEATRGHELQEMSRHDATCTEDGYISGWCLYCDEKNLIVITEEALGHNIVNGECTRCDYACEHIWETYGECQTCSLCGTTRGHDLQEMSRVDATCTEDGYISGWCSYCGATPIQETIPALGHNLVMGDCTRCDYACEHIWEVDGECQTCSLCESTRGHKVVEMGRYEPTCTENGYIVGYCEYCGTDNLTEVTDPALDHDYQYLESWTSNVCTLSGLTWYQCSRCEAKKAIETGVYGDHDYESTILKVGDCQNKYKYEYTCTACGDSYTEDGDYGSHNEVIIEETVGPNCSISGKDIYKCTICGNESSTDNGKYGEHHYEVESSTVGSNCQTSGITYYICNDCGGGYSEENGNYGDHDYGDGFDCDGETHLYTCIISGCDNTYTTDCDCHVHDYGEGVVTDPGDCKTLSTITFTCKCGDSFTEKGDYGDHGDYKLTSSTTGDNCCKAGTDTYTCEICGDTYTEKNDKYGEHSYEVESSTVGANCQTSGITYYICNDCGGGYNEENGNYGDHDYGDGFDCDGETHLYSCIIGGCDDEYTEDCDCHVHDYGEGVVTDPGDCETLSTITFTCRCGDSFTEKGDYGDHGDYELISSTTGDDCCTSGIDTYECEICGDTYEEENGDYGDCDYEVESSTTGSNCETSGVTYYICNNCGGGYSEDNGNYGDHDYSLDDSTTGADCNTSGKNYYVCSYCGDEYSESNGVYGSHDYECYNSTTGSDCETSGYDYYECGICSDSYSEENGRYGSHDYDCYNSTTGADCETSGLDYYRCSTCGDTYTSNNYEYGDHDYTIYNSTTGSDCETSGYDYYRCNNCGEEYSDENGAYGSHDYDCYKSTTGSDCETSGTDYYRCSNCGDTYSESNGDYGDHDYDCYKSTTGSDCETSGTDYYRCSNCGDTYSESNGDYGDHNYSCYNSTTGSNCKTSGTDYYRCSNCGDTYSESNSDYGDHDYSCIGSNDGDCCSKSYDIYECDTCGDTYTEYGFYGPHNYSDATCEDPETCTICDETNGSPLGHDYRSVGGDSGDCENKSYTEYECDRCGDSYTSYGGYGSHDYCDVCGNCTICSSCDSNKHDLAEYGACSLCPDGTTPADCGGGCGYCTGHCQCG